MKNSILIMTLFFLGTFMTACSNSTSSNAEKQGKEYTSAYICPMHCKGSGSDKEGKCPVCDMDYVANKKHKADGHSH